MTLKEEREDNIMSNKKKELSPMAKEIMDEVKICLLRFVRDVLKSFEAVTEKEVKRLIHEEDKPKNEA